MNRVDKSVELNLCQNGALFCTSYNTSCILSASLPAKVHHLMFIVVIMGLLENVYSTEVVKEGFSEPPVNNVNNINLDMCFVRGKL